MGPQSLQLRGQVQVRQRTTFPRYFHRSWQLLTLLSFPSFSSFSRRITKDHSSLVLLPVWQLGSLLKSLVPEKQHPLSTGTHVFCSPGTAVAWYPFPRSPDVCLGDQARSNSRRSLFIPASRELRSSLSLLFVNFHLGISDWSRHALLLLLPICGDHFCIARIRGFSKQS